MSDPASRRLWAHAFSELERQHVVDRLAPADQRTHGRPGPSLRRAACGGCSSRPSPSRRRRRRARRRGRRPAAAGSAGPCRACRCSRTAARRRRRATSGAVARLDRLDPMVRVVEHRPNQLGHARVEDHEQLAARLRLHVDDAGQRARRPARRCGGPARGRSTGRRRGPTGRTASAYSSARRRRRAVVRDRRGRRRDRGARSAMPSRDQLAAPARRPPRRRGAAARGP